MEIFASSLSVCISLILLLGTYVLWRDYWIDEMRDKLFALRDEMFLYAYENDLIDTEAHRFLRDLMNSVIRYAHEISAGRLLVLVFARSVVGSAPTNKFESGQRAISNLPSGQRDAMMQYQYKLVALMGRQLIKTSIVLRSVALLLSFVLWLVRPDTEEDAKKRLTKKMPVDLLERDAMISCPA